MFLKSTFGTVLFQSGGAFVYIQCMLETALQMIHRGTTFTDTFPIEHLIVAIA